MNTGTCYVFASDSELVAFPLLSCSDGDILQLSESTTAEDYIIISGRLFKVRERSVDSSDFRDSSVLHVWSANSQYFLDMNFALIAGVGFIICFFTILFHWFIRLRG